MEIWISDFLFYENCHTLRLIRPLYLGYKYATMKTLLALPLVSWDNGIIMIAVFGAVVVALVLAVLMMMNSGKK